MSGVTYRASREISLDLLADGKPRSVVEVSRATGLTRNQVGNALMLAWRRGLVLRTAAPLLEQERVRKGRGGVSFHMRPYHLYLGKPSGREEVELGGRRYVSFAPEYLDPRGGGGASKAGLILGFLRERSDRAFFSTEVAEALKDRGVKVRDVMSSARRWERRGLVYVRGYKGAERQTPFREGYMLTWVDQDRPRDEAFVEAVGRTEAVVNRLYAGSQTMERIHRIRDMIMEHTRLRRLVAYDYIENELRCNHDQSEHALSRTLQLYPDLHVEKLFGAYRYFYHSSMSAEDLSAAMEMTRNYLRLMKGRDNRVGHNWEAAAEWFIDRFTSGARFWSQQHREGGMDSRRITLHLLKGVGGRRVAAEVDRVWEVTPGVFAPPVTYVLSCKWGLVDKRHVDDFLEVLRWSKDFGVDTPDGRDVKQGVVGVFAASAFNPKERVGFRDGSSLSLAEYASRRRLQLITAADFNGKLREKGCPSGTTVQKLCKLAGGEGDVRAGLDAVWKDPLNAEKVFTNLLAKNEGLFRFEKMLEAKEESTVSRL